MTRAELAAIMAEVEALAARADALVAEAEAVVAEAGALVAQRKLRAPLQQIVLELPLLRQRAV